MKQNVLTVLYYQDIVIYVFCSIAPSRAKVFGMETSRVELEMLLTKCREHRQNVQQLLLKQEYQRSQAAMRRKMLENLDDSMKSQRPKVMYEFVVVVVSMMITFQEEEMTS